MTDQKICKYLHCGHALYALGLCLAHYRQHSQGEELHPVHRRSRQEGCSVEGCLRPHRASGLCSAHYAQAQRGEELRPLSTDEPVGECSFPGCGRPRLSRGWCGGHYNQEREGRPMNPLRTIDPERGCRVATCSGRHYAQGLCKNHVRKGYEYGLAPDEVVDLFSRAACEACGGHGGTPGTPCRRSTTTTAPDGSGAWFTAAATSAWGTSGMTRGGSRPPLGTCGMQRTRRAGTRLSVAVHDPGLITGR